MAEQKYNVNNIIEEFCIHEDYNFLAFAVTPWHAHGVDASIKYLLDKGISLKGIIVLYPHAVSGLSVSQQHFSMTDKGEFKFVIFEYDYKHSIWNQIKYLLSSDKKGKRVIYFSKAWRPNCSLASELYVKINNSNIHHIIFDEGLSTYMYSSISSAIQGIQEKGILGLAKKIIHVFRFIRDNIVFNNIIKKYHSYTELTLFNQKRKCLVKNDVAIKYYKEVIKRLAIKFDIPLIGELNGSLLISTQPDFENGEVYDNEDIKIIDKVESVCRKMSVNTVIKPHPREKFISRYQGHVDSVIDDLQYSLEMIFASLGREKPLLVVGNASTALVTAKVLFDIDAVSLINLIDRRKYAEVPNFEMERFEKMFGDYVFMPESIGELVSLLKNKINNNLNFSSS